MWAVSRRLPSVQRSLGGPTVVEKEAQGSTCCVLSVRALGASTCSCYDKSCLSASVWSCAGHHRDRAGSHTFSLHTRGVRHGLWVLFHMIKVCSGADLASRGRSTLKQTETTHRNPTPQPQLTVLSKRVRQSWGSRWLNNVLLYPTII